eukprot:m.8940 g.8940  ORF g.8940 m.8940 type:complete len:165 (+) comp20992_c0_seq1:72-566(+)
MKAYVALVASSVGLVAMTVLIEFLCVGYSSADYADDPLHQHGRSHDKEHIQEHLKEMSDAKTEGMSSEELQFHYFKLHDYDKNDKLDGIELTAALTHFDREDDHKGEGDSDGEKGARHDIPDIDEKDIIGMVDQVLEQEDLNGDGFVSYSEFRHAQKLDSEADA